MSCWQSGFVCEHSSWCLDGDGGGELLFSTAAADVMPSVFTWRRDLRPLWIASDFWTGANGSNVN